MFKSIYIRLAFTNLKKNKRSYLPFLVTSIITIMLFFDMSIIMDNSGIKEMPGAGSMRSILGFGTVIVAIFACVFLFYTNSFLIKQRRKEIGLYNVLGMGKKEIAIMMFWESLMVGGASILAGILGGIILGRLMFLLLYKIIGYQTSLQYEVTGSSISTTLILFAVIFFVAFVSNLIQVRKANPIELLRGGNVGEKEPKTKILLTVFGVVTIAAGYILANIVENPIEAISVFFVAVLLVVIGTYALFVAGSIAFFKLLRKNKSFYYKAKHFHSVSGMIYRMKQNAVGLANICILSTMVLVTLSTTVGLNLGMENIMENRFPKELILTIEQSNEETIRTVDTVVAEELNRQGIRQENGYRCQSVSMVTDKEKDGFSFYAFGSLFYPNRVLVQLAPVSYYNEMMGENLELSDQEAVIYTSSKTPYGKDHFRIEDTEFTIVEEPDAIPMEKKQNFPVMESYILFVKDQTVINNLISSLPESGEVSMEYSYGFDLTGSEEKKEAAAEAITNRIQNDYGIGGYLELRGVYEEDFHMFYGSFFFLGIFLGGLFLMATVLIIYYKQISEGFEDRNRYQIMQKVGMSRREVKKTVNSQIRMVFFLPLGLSVLHLAAAFQLIRRLLSSFNLTNTNLIVACTIGTVLIFALIYAFVFKLTAREYYKIVTR